GPPAGRSEVTREAREELEGLARAHGARDRARDLALLVVGVDADPPVPTRLHEAARAQVDRHVDGDGPVREQRQGPDVQGAPREVDPGRRRGGNRRHEPSSSASPESPAGVRRAGGGSPVSAPPDLRSRRSRLCERRPSITRNTGPRFGRGAASGLALRIASASSAAAAGTDTRTSPSSGTVSG